MKTQVRLIIVFCALGIGMSTQATVEAISVGLEGTNSYTVPPDKFLIIEYITHVMNGGDEHLGVVVFTPPDSSHKFRLYGSKTSSMAMKFSSGTTIYPIDPSYFPASCAFSGLLVDSSDLYANRGEIDGMSIRNSLLTMHVSGPPGQRSQVSVESTYDLLGADWRREQEALVTKTEKGSSEFEIEVPIASADQTFYKARFRPKN